MLDEGFEIIEDACSEMDIDLLADELCAFEFLGRKAGVRNIEKKSDVVSAYCKSNTVLAVASRYLSGEPKLVRAIYFNKTSQNNWLVSWHQDKTVAVSKQFEAEGWEAWSIKDGVYHVQPPLEVLESMVTLRIHLDAATMESGCLKLIPKSHEQGILSQEKINNIVSVSASVNCKSKRGAILVMRPHILHSSSKAIKPVNRRILHLEFSSYALPKGISWA